MASQRSLGDLLVRIVGENAEFDKSIDNSEKKLKQFGDNASKIGGNLTKFITLPLVGIGVAAVKSAADMEQAQLSFETLLGSGEKAKVLLNQLKQFASTTPFEFQDLAQGAKTLLSFGIAADKILPITKQLGDIALGDSEKFKSLSVVFGQISSTGRLMGQDLLQLINVGFNPLQEISKRTGESMAELKKRMEAGGISAEEVAAAFKSATSEGGRFFEGTQKLGTSFTGLVSTLKDNAAELARGFGELVLPTLKDFVSGISGILQSLNEMDPSTKKFILQLGLTLAAIGPVIAIVGKLSQALQFLGKNPIILVITALVALTEAVIFLSQAEERQIEAWDKQIETLKELAGETDAILGPMDDLSKNNKLSIDQISALTKLYPELTNQIKLNNTTVGEAAKLAEDAAKGRAVQGFNETNKALSEQRVILDGLNKSIADASRPGVVSFNLPDIKKRAEETQAKIAGLQIQNQQFKESIDKVNASWFKGPFSKDAQVVAKSTEQDIFAIRAAEEKLLQQRLIANEGFKNISDNVHAGYIGQQMDIEETARIQAEAAKADEEIRLNANSGFRQQSIDIAAGFAERSIAGKLASDEIARTNFESGEKQIAENLKVTNSFLSGYQVALGVATSFFDALASLSAQESANRIAELEEQNAVQLAGIDAALQAELAANGVADLSAVELAQKKLDTAKASNDAEAIADAEKALLKAQIEQKYADQVTKINDKFEKDKAQQQYKGELAAWEFKLASALAAAPVAIINAIQTGYGAGFPAGIVLGPALGIAAGIATAIQLAAIGSSKPKPPKLADGGIALPRPGGIMANIAEAGQAEAIIPLDRMNEFIDNRGFGGGGSQSSESFPVNLTIKLSERQLYKGIFQATRNREILIDAQSVVG